MPGHMYLCQYEKEVTTGRLLRFVFCATLGSHAHRLERALLVPPVTSRCHHARSSSPSPFGYAASLIYSDIQIILFFVLDFFMYLRGVGQSSDIIRFQEKVNGKDPVEVKIVPSQQ